LTLLSEIFQCGLGFYHYEDFNLPFVEKLLKLSLSRIREALTNVPEEDQRHGELAWMGWVTGSSEGI